MTEFLPNKHGLTHREAWSLLDYAFHEAQFEGDTSFAQSLQKYRDQYKAALTSLPDEYFGKAQCFNPIFNQISSKLLTSWRKRNGITAWEEMARLRANWDKEVAKSRFPLTAGC